MIRPDNPLIVQSDRSLMLHTVRTLVDTKGHPVRDEGWTPRTEEHPRFAAARDALRPSPSSRAQTTCTPTASLRCRCGTRPRSDSRPRRSPRRSRSTRACRCRGARDRDGGWIARYGQLKIERRARPDGGEAFELVSNSPTRWRTCWGTAQCASCAASMPSAACGSTHCSADRSSRR